MRPSGLDEATGLAAGKEVESSRGQSKALAILRTLLLHDAGRLLNSDLRELAP